jgi:hypothetical protein
MYIYIYMYIYVNICIYMYIHIFTYIYIYIYICIDIEWIFKLDLCIYLGVDHDIVSARESVYIDMNIYTYI